ncbi:MAG: hypothetical protein ACREOO_31065 [bacterium]
MSLRFEKDSSVVGISIVLLAGKGYESADDWAALLACGVIGWNGWRLLRAAIAEVMDTPPPELESQIRAVTKALPGVINVEKLRARKSGLSYDGKTIFQAKSSMAKLCFAKFLWTIILYS